MTHTELLAALEAATGPGRELDAAIWLAIHRPNYKYPRQVMNRTPSSYAEAVERHTVSVDRGITAPAYTASLDAGRALLLPGWEYVIFSPEKRVEIWAKLGADDTYDVIADATANTVENALCIAAIRARGGE